MSEEMVSYAVYKLFQMLNVAVSGHTSSTFDTAARCVAELWQDDEYENLRKNGANYPGMSSSESSNSVSSGGSDKSKQPVVQEKPPENDAVKLAARLVIVYCVKCLQN